MSRIITVQPLDAEAFQPFGDVIQAAGVKPQAINQDTCLRFDDLADLDVVDLQGRACLSIFRPTPQHLPFEAHLLERHPLSSQAFMPLEPTRFLIVVAPHASHPEPEQVRAFVSEGHQGVNIHRGVWHHPLIALESESDFLVIDRKGPEPNCDEWFPGEPILIQAPA